MNRDEIIKSICNVDKLGLIYLYCIDKGKSEQDTSGLIKYLVVTQYYINYCYNVAFDYFCQHYNIILLHDKNGKFIKAF